MAPQSDREDIETAWRALAGAKGAESGWRTIQLSGPGICRMFAGRRHPDNEEALLVSFPTQKIPPNADLPKGRGFRTAGVKGVVDGLDANWIALWRTGSGGLELFTVMAVDVARSVRAVDTGGEGKAFSAFIARIVAWQRFMERGRDDLLSPQEEVGLFGELIAFAALLDTDMSLEAVAESWMGPIDGLHDFVLATGELEIKTTLSAVDFPARISSLEQLDTTGLDRLVLLGIRPALEPDGKSLGQLVSDLSERLRADAAAADLFERRLIAAGFLPRDADAYSRRFKFVQALGYVVSEGFPRIVRSTTTPIIRDASYEINLELIVPDARSIGEGILLLRNASYDA